MKSFFFALAIAAGGAFCASGGPAPNYWCTWATQGATLGRNVKPGKPLGLFGAFKSVTLTGGVTKGMRIRARQLPYGKPRDVTALCRITANGAVVIPGTVQEKPHGAYTPNVVLESVPPCDDPASAGNAE